MQHTIKERLREDAHKINDVQQLEQYKVFLVKDTQEEGTGGEQWFRAMLTTKVFPHQETMNAFYIDYGVVKPVSITQIYSLQEANHTLFRYPPQAILVRLDKIPVVNSKMLDQIRQLLPASKEAVVSKRHLFIKSPFHS